MQKLNGNTIVDAFRNALNLMFQNNEMYMVRGTPVDQLTMKVDDGHRWTEIKLELDDQLIWNLHHAGNLEAAIIEAIDSLYTKTTGAIRGRTYKEMLREAAKPYCYIGPLPHEFKPGQSVKIEYSELPMIIPGDNEVQSRRFGKSLKHKK